MDCIEYILDKISIFFYHFAPYHVTNTSLNITTYFGFFKSTSTHTKHFRLLEGVVITTLGDEFANALKSVVWREIEALS